MPKTTFPFVLLCVLLASCSTGRKTAETQNTSNSQKPNTESNIQANASPAVDPGGALNHSNSNEMMTTNAVARAACMNVNTGKNRVQKSQTFAINFEPFKNSCFVTSYNPEYDDPPMESEFAVYKNGKKVFTFPDQFNGATFGCWVEAVAFQDLNRNGLNDIIVVGKCSAKATPYYENMVYVNTGKTFTTNEDGNNKLNDFKKTKEIADFVEENQQIFFK